MSLVVTNVINASLVYMMRWVRNDCFILLLVLCFMVTTVNPSYFDCLKEHSDTLQAQNNMPDCHMPKDAPTKDCCTKLSCPKCFTTTSSLAAGIAFQLEQPPIPSPVANTSKVNYHYSDMPERPPKIS